MNDDQFRELRQLILDLAVRVEVIELHLKRQDREANERMGPIRDLMAAIVLAGDEEDDIPGAELQN